MKKAYLSALALLGSVSPLLAQNVATRSAQPANGPAAPAILHRSCASHDVLQAQMAADPALARRMADIEARVRSITATASVGKGGTTTTGTLTIPVVVHVLWNSPAEDISDTQVQTQIDVLNEDYQKRNTDGTGSYLYSGAAGGMTVQFVLSRVIHKYTKTRSWSTNDAVKSSKRGGDDPLDPAHNLNMWACNLGQGLLGYAQFPGGAPATDGVVILYSAFGSRAKMPSGTTGTFISKYDLGRTATHEVGHWMNLRHIWGDDGGACTGSDLVDDTPNQADENYGCPASPNASCNNNGDMYMNYMDYTDDRCMFMFSQGQVDRMNLTFGSGGPRASFASSTAALRVAGTTKSVSIFPNPGTDAVSLALPADEDASRYSVRVFDMSGHEMLQTKYDGQGQLKVGELPKGLYYISINDGVTTTRQRFEKE